MVELGIIVMNRLAGASAASVDIAWLRLPAHVRRDFERAMFARRRGDHHEARKWLEAVTRTEPDFAAAWIALGILDLETKRTRAAVEHFDRAVAAGPESPRALLWRAAARYLRKDLAAAEADVERCLTLGGGTAADARRLLALIRTGRPPGDKGGQRAIPAEPQPD